MKFKKPLYRLFLVTSIMLLSGIYCCSFAQTEKKGYKIKTVVLDPGHGGHDPGAVGLKYHEKDIVLKVAIELGKLIETSYPDVKVVFTRKTDEFVGLIRRAQIANQNKADLFISIHCNASKNKAATGAETFVLGLDKTSANLEVTKKENAVILLEDNYLEKYQGFDPNLPESNIIFSLFQNAFLDQSLLFSQKIQKHLINKTSFTDRGVKQAGFWVLCYTAMPSVLVELGFISNKTEEETLGSDKGIKNMAMALFNAFKDYKERMEGGFSISEDTTNKPAEKNDSTTQPQTNNVKLDSIKESETVNIVSFRVQFTASSTNKPLNAPEFEGLKDVKVYFMNSLYRYTSGDFKTLEEAAEWQVSVQSKGFKDAFVVAFHNEIRISPQEAIKLLKNN